ncbi:DALR anticodon-binding domain-containing protein [Sneathiella sp.]|uniref:DALR anticodon-binding domain-containing protein n=1 Tax=Sneathiella sp. TaxID=1964365 RepID=UPI002FE32D6F
MIPSYAVIARRALLNALPATAFADDAAWQRFMNDLRLRPPQRSAYGDLTTNAAILLTAMLPGAEAERHIGALIKAFGALPGVKDVARQPSGYLNLYYESSYWTGEIPEILTAGAAYGLGDLTLTAAIAPAPEEAADLAALRRQVNAAALFRLADLAGVAVTRARPAPLTAESGYPAAAALSKCGEGRVKFALLANPPAFTGAFSPILATDRSYNNPVFALPYARMLLRRLAAGREAGIKAIEEGADLSRLRLPGEISLARRLADWPLAVEETLRKADGYYLASFLHDLSLLFFRQFETLRPVSSDYLQGAAGEARIALFAAVETILDGGMTVLGVDMVKEYG